MNEDAYDAWIIKIKMSDPEELDSLINSDGYEASIEE
ncbi:hypothetical protein L0O83_18750 [Lawsonibacter sp. DFI.5.51]|nr:hypothetical protein [Lawsonibacter sp. DFI.5.51]